MWRWGELRGDRLITILSSCVSDEYLTTLRDTGVSYILAATDDVDLAAVMQQLDSRFGVRTLMLEGGAGLNGAMLQAGLVDEISVLVAPVVDGRSGIATLFDQPPLVGAAHRVRLQRVDRVTDDVLHLRDEVLRG